MERRKAVLMEYMDIMKEVQDRMLNDITASRIRCEAKYHETDNQLGFGSIIIDSQIKITGIRVMKSKKHPGEVYLSMPGKAGQEGYFPFCSLSEKWYKEILVQMYIDILMQKQPLPAQVGEVNIRKTESGKLKAIAEVQVEGILIRNIKLLQLEKGYVCMFPQIQTGEGYKDIIYPLTPELRKTITDAVVEAYQNQET